MAARQGARPRRRRPLQTFSTARVQSRRVRVGFECLNESASLVLPVARGWARQASGASGRASRRPRCSCHAAPTKPTSQAAPTSRVPRGASTRGAARPVAAGPRRAARSAGVEEVAQLVDPRDPSVPTFGQPARLPEGIGLEQQRRRAAVHRPLPPHPRQLQPESLLLRAVKQVAIAGGTVRELRPPIERDLQRELLPPRIALDHAGGGPQRAACGALPRGEGWQHMLPSVELQRSAAASRIHILVGAARAPLSSPRTERGAQA
eukprot:scaffold23848_cov42-Phaeocystis_antarctica.AAC.3